MHKIKLKKELLPNPLNPGHSLAELLHRSRVGQPDPSRCMERRVASLSVLLSSQGSHEGLKILRPAGGEEPVPGIKDCGMHDMEFPEDMVGEINRGKAAGGDPPIAFLSGT